MSKPREYELFYSCLAGTFSVRNNYSAYLALNKQDRQDDEYIRVIEYSAYLEVVKQRDEANRKLLELEAGRKSWYVAREIEINANSEHEWNQTLEKLTAAQARVAELERVLNEIINDEDGDWQYAASIARRAIKVGRTECTED